MRNPTAQPQRAATAPETAGQAVAEPQPAPTAEPANAEPVDEIGGPAGPEPTRFGDWERKGRCIDF